MKGEPLVNAEPPRIDVRDYCACDGVTDDATALVRALGSPGRVVPRGDMENGWVVGGAHGETRRGKRAEEKLS